MIVIKDKKKASMLRRELAAELSKPMPDPNEIQRIRTDIYRCGGRCGWEPRVQKWVRKCQ